MKQQPHYFDISAVHYQKYYIGFFSDWIGNLLEDYLIDSTLLLVFCSRYKTISNFNISAITVHSK